jgi:O-acetyl-ADP-ribose deacetylase (regulator of RNase III)
MEASGIRILVERGDLTKLEVDAVVNAANTHLWMGAGVAGALLRAGGEVIEQEAMELGPIAAGSAVATTAGALPARHVIHAATMDQDLVTSPEIVRRATASALELAEELGLASVAFPALGTGVGGLDYDRCAREMLAAARAHEQASLQTVHFSLFSDDAVEAFKRVLAESESRG